MIDRTRTEERRPVLPLRESGVGVGVEPPPRTPEADEKTRAHREDARFVTDWWEPEQTGLARR